MDKKKRRARKKGSKWRKHVALVKMVKTRCTCKNGSKFKKKYASHQLKWLKILKKGGRSRKKNLGLMLSLTPFDTYRIW